MKKNEVIESVKKALEVYVQNSGYQVLEAYVTKSDMFSDHFNVFVRTTYPALRYPYDDFAMAHKLVQDHLGENKSLVDRILIMGQKNNIPFENNMVLHPSNGDTFLVLWHQAA